MMQFQKCNDCRGGRVRIRGIKRVIVVFRPSVRKKEALAPKVVSSLERLTKKSRVGIGTIFHYTRKRLQQISGVKVVYPRLICSSAVRPRAIVALPFHNISHSAYSQIAKVT